MKVLVTGSAGRLARVLIPQMATDPGIGEITGVDLQNRTYPTPLFQAAELDARAPRLAETMRGVDVAIHLAFVLMGGGLGHDRHRRSVVRDMNLAAVRNVAQAAVAAGVHRLVFVSSVAAYGAWPDNPQLIEEGRELRPNPGFGYAEDKAEAERWLEAFGRAHPELQILRLRLHAVIGPHAHPVLRFLLRQPFYPATGHPRPVTQCVWEEDAAAAIVCALHRGTPGAYNIAAQPAMSFYDMLGIRSRLRLPCPVGLAARLHGIVWRLTPSAGEPGWVAGLRHHLAVDTRRAQSELGWRPRLDTRQCIEACTTPVLV